MAKGGQRYANMDQDGKWFAHVGLQQSEISTTTGAMLSQATPQHMQGQQRYPKSFIDTEKGLGRKKCLDDRRQHNSHFCFCHDDTVCSVWPKSRNRSSYQTDFQLNQTTESTSGTQHKRRFSRNHRETSHQAAVAQAEEAYMWFGRHDTKYRTPLYVLADANLSSTS